MPYTSKMTTASDDSSSHVATNTSQSCLNINKSYIFQSSKEYLDTLASNNYYTVHELMEDGVVFTSSFNSYSDAKKFVNKFTHASSVVYIFKTYCKDTFAPITNEETDDEDYVPQEETTTDKQYDVDLSNMTLITYGKGYLLIPPEDSEFYGEKYFQDGWWIKRSGGWFFKSEHYDFLVSSGAFYDGDEECHNETLDENGEDTDDTIVNAAFGLMCLKQYKKGYLLIPPEDHHDYGTKYYHNGFWNKALKGWIFKPEHYDFLVSHGAIEYGANVLMETVVVNEPEEPEVEVVEDDFDMSNTYFEAYKRGYVVYPSKYCSFSGEKYLYSGFWNKTLGGWVFKSSDYDFLIEKGSLFVHSASDNVPVKQEGRVNLQIHYSNNVCDEETKKNLYEFETADSEFVSVSTGNMVPKFEVYRDRWLLSADENYHYDGTNTYFEGGVYNHRAHGWIFTNEQKNIFLNKYY